MALIQVNNLNKYYGATPILRDLNLTIQAGEKWGLVGRNGCGKTTLMKIFTGEEDFDSGEFHYAQNCRIGYLKQEPDFKADIAIYDELRNIFTDLDELGVANCGQATTNVRARSGIRETSSTH